MGEKYPMYKAFVAPVFLLMQCPVFLLLSGGKKMDATGFTAKSQCVGKGRTCVFAADILWCLNAVQRENQMVLWFDPALCFGDPSASHCVTSDQSVKPTDAKVNTNCHTHLTMAHTKSSTGKQTR